MKENAGLTIEDAQLAICRGTYGNKEWSKAEKQAGCQRYEEMTGSQIRTYDGSEVLVVLIPALLLVGAYVLYVGYVKRRKTEKRRK